MSDEQNELMKKVIVKLNKMVDYTYGRTLIILIKNGLVSPYMGLFVECFLVFGHYPLWPLKS